LRELILAVEVGGTKLQLAIGNAEGDILHNHRLQVVPSLGSQGILNAIIESLPMLREKAAAFGGELSRIGVGFGGILDSRNGVTIASEQIEGWRQFPLREYLQEKTKIPTRVFNDTNAAAWGEYYKGTGKGSDIFFYTNIGSGIGGGVVINGELYDGHGFGAAEIGQTHTYDAKSEKAYPFLQVEKICSGWAMEARLRSEAIPADSMLWKLCEQQQQKLTCAMLGSAAGANDPYACAFLDDVTHIFSVALANVISLYSPQCVAIGGGVSLMGEPLFSRIRAFTRQYVAKSCVGRYRIEKSLLGEEIVLVGALLLAAKKSPVFSMGGKIGGKNVQQRK